ncbi:syntaxin-binding protein 5-like isoform X3 [Tachypleus tridentatus]|uniref:syntaxin-binding protein 5-like isoform X3 n=1 Tax=Tachypleus tridentatus TaxID=6853 RepID=UPI003FD02415
MPRTEMKRTGGFFKGMLDGLRSSVSQPVKSETEIEESLQTEHFQAVKTVRHGFPFQPTALAFDPIQRLLAIGTRSGSLRILGRPGVDCYVQHVLDTAVIQLLFLVNEGALISVCSDDSLHLWNLRQKRPEIVHSLKFQKERITCCHLPFQSNWLYIGTERGNIHVVNVESFILSGYVINWNKAIELSRKTHPGCVIHLSDNPVDANKLLVGYETGAVVLWDLRNRAAEMRLQNTEPLKSVSWHHDGKQFMCSHTDGSISTWNLRTPLKPTTIMHPHAQATSKEGKAEPCKTVYKVEWKTVRGGDSFVIFSGGLPHEKTGKTLSLTVIHGKTTTVLEMEHTIVDFVTLCETPWQSDFQEPYAIVVLLNNDLVVVDLTSQGYPCFQNPYPMDLHESPVTFCSYFAECPADLIPAFYSVGSKGSKRSGFSEKEWPICGGEWGTGTVSYPEIIITGHADGSIKFWDASAVALQVLYKLKTSKVFERPKPKSLDGQEDDPFAVEQIYLCVESRVLCMAGASSHVIMFKFNKQESTSEVTILEIPIIYDVDDDPECSPEADCSPRPTLGVAFQQGSYSSASEDSAKKQPTTEYYVPLKVKSGPQKRAAGFQPDLVCLTPWVDGEPPGHITALSVNSSYGLMAYGNECGLVVVDIIQRTCLLNMGTPDLYGSSDPYQRVPRSPKRNPIVSTNDNGSLEQDRCRSPTSDQLAGPVVTAEPHLTFSQSTSSSHSVSSSHSSQCDNISSEVINSNDSTRPVRPPRRKTKKLQNAGPKSCKASEQRTIESTEVIESPELDAVCQNDVEQKQETGVQNYQLACGTASSPSGEQSVFYVNIVSSYCSLENKNSLVQETCCNKTDYAETKAESQELKGSQMKRGKSLWQQNPLKNIKRCASQVDSMPTDAVDGEESELKQKEWMKKTKRNTRRIIVDLRYDVESPLSPMVKMFDKIDNSFSRSRSSSMSSLENISAEAIQWLSFAETFFKKSDSATGRSLWVGTSLGSVIVVLLTLPANGDIRLTQPVIVSPSGTIYRMKGSVLSVAFLDSSGALIPYLSESWRDISRNNNKEKDDKKMTPMNNSSKNRASPTSSSSEVKDSQFVVMASEKQARVVALPSQTCVYKTNLTDTSFVVRAEVIPMKSLDNACLACYIGNGNIVVYSLPSLRLLYEVDFLPLMDMRIAKTFCFSNNGHGLYLCSASEFQKFSISAAFCEVLQDMLGTLFLTKDMPEPPKQGFFKGLFGGGPSVLDREELFGEASGKASKSVARHIPGNSNLEHVKGQAGSLAGELARARQGLTERGEALGLLEERTAKMMSEAEMFSNTTHNLLLRYKDKKWYQF